MVKDDWTPYVVEEVMTVHREDPDGFYVCCASFEERSLGAVRRLSRSYRCQRSAIFIYDSPVHREDRLRSFEGLRQALLPRTLDRLDVIPCDKGNVFDGVVQFREVLLRLGTAPSDITFTLDITTFTKLYLLELLHLLTVEFGVRRIRILCTLPSAYGSGRLSYGATEVITMPHFSGFLPINGNVLMIAFLGFEGERGLAILERYDPRSTLALVSDPEYRDGYRRRAEAENSFLLSRPGVKLEAVSPYNPMTALEKLEQLYAESLGDSEPQSQGVVLVPLGTHMQAVSTFLFWRRHQQAQVAYAFPSGYGPAYKQRRPAQTLSVDLGPALSDGT